VISVCIIISPPEGREEGVVKLDDQGGEEAVFQSSLLAQPLALDCAVFYVPTNTV